VTRYTLIAVLLVLLSFVVQQFVPAFTGWHHSRLLLVQLAFLCTAVTVNQPVMLLLAFGCGLLWDAQCTPGRVTGDPEIYTQPVEALRFGYSILLFGGMGALMQGVQPLFRQGKWYFSAVLSGIAVFLYLAAEYGVITLVRGHPVLTQATLRQMFWTAVITMLLSPPFFWLLSAVARHCQHTLFPEAVEKKKRRMLLS
jgi:cell shape-determining protein MreD